MTQTAGFSTSASAAVPRRPLRFVDLGWYLPILAVLAAGVLIALDDDQLGDRRLLRIVLVGVAVLLYLLMRRWSVWGWLAALCAAPAALGAELLDLPGDGSFPTRSVAVAAGVSIGLASAAWRARRPLPVVVTVLVTTVAGLVGASVLGASVVGSEHPARLSWSAASTFFVLALPAAAGLLAAVGLARAEGLGPLRLVCGLAVAAPLVALLAARGDALAALVWWPAAGGLGLTAMLRGRRGSEVDRPQSDDVDDEAVASFDRDFQQPTLAPVVIVIAAYNEAEGLPDVLSRMPTKVCSMPADVVVVDDGSTDGTAEVAARAVADLGRGYVVACPANRGQGAALRLGYRVARDHGAAYIVTTDADGQYQVDDMSIVLRPVVDGRADFVTGSRRRGALHNRDRVRQLGTYAFAWLASALLGRYLTDTSFGLRAMRPEVTAAVTLNQPQYQASELLVGAASHGFTVLEVPATMRRRSAGVSKKGGNLVYGYRYGSVMLGTWWREGAPRPVSETAPALRSAR